jgi:hypothetical protein
MMPFKELLPVYRAEHLGDTNVYPGSPSHSEYGFIQPQDPTLALTDSSFSKTFRMFAELGANFKEADRIEYDGKTMQITGVQNFKFGGHPHLEITLELVI